MSRIFKLKIWTFYEKFRNLCNFNKNWDFPWFFQKKKNFQNSMKNSKIDKIQNWIKTCPDKKCEKSPFETSLNIEKKSQARKYKTKYKLLSSYQAHYYV